MLDAPRMTACALLGVCLLVVVLCGIRGAAFVLLPLFVGLLWLLAGLGVLGWRLNFLNFAALPISIGVGADYAANLWARLRHELSSSERPGDESLPALLSRVVADTGSAVSLCSLTTIIGYSSLLLSKSRALQSFGRLANLGEVTCLLAALVVLPCLAALWLRRRPR
jgi:predicted RND superfamily exporter protein